MPESGGGGAGVIGRIVNPVPTGEGRLSPPITTGTPNVFHLPASLYGITLCAVQLTVFPETLRKSCECLY